MNTIAQPRPFAGCAFLSVAAFLAGALPFSLRAQTVTGSNALSASPSAETTDVVTLPEFSVTAGPQTGTNVAANDTLGAMRIRSSLTEIPIAVSVITEDLIENFELYDPDALGPFVAGWLPGEIEAGGGGGSRLRGFVPLPFRNGFERTGVGEVVNLERVEIIKGPLSAMFGRANPGGIFNYVTKRAKRKGGYSFSAAAGTYDYQRYEGHFTGPVLADNLFYRVDGSYHYTEGEQDFFFTDTQALSGALTWELSRDTQIVLELERLERVQNRGTNGALVRYDSLANPRTGANVSNVIGGIGEEITRAGFNQHGPDARVYRGITTADLRLEHRFNGTWSLRGNVQWWDRNFDDYRWTTPEYYVQRGLFVGREPFRHYQPEEATAFQVDLLGQMMLGAAVENKLLLSIDWTDRDYAREDWRMRVAERNSQLPTAVRNLSSATPEYGTYGRSSLTRQTLQSEEVFKRTGFLVSERLATLEGRLIAFAAARYERYEMDYLQRSRTTDSGNRVGIFEDITTGALMEPTTGRREDHAVTFSYGVNYKLNGDKLVLFANRSESFEGFQSRIDRGLGQLIDAPEGVGYEAGLRGRILNDSTYWTLSAFDITRDHIAQRNPLYVSDPDTGELPEGVAEFIGLASERSKGGELEVFGDITPNFSATFAVGYVDAYTEKNPDAPVIEGRKLLRAPEWNVGATATYRFRAGALKDWTIGSSLRYTDRHYARFGGFGSTVTGTGVIDPNPTQATLAGAETTARIEEIRPSATLVSLFVQKAWKWGGVQQVTRVSASNLFDREWWTVTGRFGVGREVRLSHSIRF